MRNQEAECSFPHPSFTIHARHIKASLELGHRRAFQKFVRRILLREVQEAHGGPGDPCLGVGVGGQGEAEQIGHPAPVITNSQQKRQRSKKSLQRFLDRLFSFVKKKLVCSKLICSRSTSLIDLFKILMDSHDPSQKSGITFDLSSCPLHLAPNSGLASPWSRCHRSGLASSLSGTLCVL